MRKLLISMLMLSSFIFVGSSFSTSGVAMAKPQVRIQIGQRRHYRDRYWNRNRDYAEGDRVGYGRTFTRDVQSGWRHYRETYRVVRLPNGMTQTQLISRVRLY